MVRPVFISHSVTDRHAAEAICEALEAQGQSCWIAPRNIPPGAEWAVAIMAGIVEARVVLLVHSAASSGSQMVRREINVAVDSRKSVIPVQIDATPPQASMQFYLGNTHWLDASVGLLPAHLPRIVAAVFERLGLDPDARVPPPTRRRRRPRALAPPLAVVPLAVPDKPSIAVLAFTNMSGDPEQEYFSDGMAEEITTAIARLPWLFVIARNSSFTYKGKSVDVKQVARELGVRYVLEGSVRKAGNRLRITGQLIDTATGAHIWADRFDGSLEDVFELQDQIASSVVGAIEPRLRQSEIERAGRLPLESLHAYDFYLRALAQLHRYTDEGLAETVSLLQQALAVNPSYAPAAALVGWCRVFQGVQGWGVLSDVDISIAVHLARQALEAEHDDAETVARAGFTLFYFAGETAMAMAALDRGLQLNPNMAAAWQAKGMIHSLRNQSELAIEASNRALRLSPFDPLGFISAAALANAHLLAGRFEQAIEWADRALHAQPRFGPSRRIKIAATAQLGRLDEARAELGRLLAIEPGATIASFRANSARAAHEFIDVVAAGLRLAGLAEG
jgi:adenylate cyclase